MQGQGAAAAVAVRMVRVHAVSWGGWPHQVQDPGGM